MARQEGIAPFSGRLGDFVYYRRNDKYFVRRAPENVRQTEATKQSCSDFTTACNAAKQITGAFKPLTKDISDGEAYGRLKSLSIKLLNKAPVQLRGNRLMTHGDISLLKHFEFNRYTAMASLTALSPVVTIEPRDQLTVTLLPAPASETFFPPAKAVSAIIQFRCCVFHFDKEEIAFQKPDDKIVELNAERFKGGKFSISMEGAESCILILAWSLKYLNKEGNVIRDRRYYAANILEAVNIENGKIIPFIAPAEIPDPELNDKPSSNAVPWSDLE